MKQSTTKSTMTTPIDDLDPKNHIIIKGARVNNLKNIDVAIPRNKMVVITGLSGSGKSSLAFDTLFAEGQRMYVESLNSYARQFLGRMEKPDVDYIKGVSPAIAIEQKTSTKNPRSTVGTTTEIYDYLKLLFARIGETFSPISGKKVQKDHVTDVVDYILNHPEGTKVIVSCPFLHRKDKTVIEELQILLQKGYTRILFENEMVYLEEILEKPTDFDKTILKNPENICILIDRAIVKINDEETLFRFSDSVQTAFFEGEGICFVEIITVGKKTFSDKFELDGMSFEEPSLNLFSFNNSFGACKTCDGYGKVLGLDIDLVIPEHNLSVYEGAIAPWRSEKMSDWLLPLIKNATSFDFPIHRPYKELTEAQKKLLWTGNKYFEGLDVFFSIIEKESYKIQYRVMLSRYRAKTICHDCKGSRLRKDASYVMISDKSIVDLVLLPVEKLHTFFETIDLNAHQHKVADRILVEIKNRISYLERVGLGYLTLNRLTSSLSGGEFQRIKLATTLGSSLVGSMYILDEPSIGLHPRDTLKLVSVLESLRDLGNTVIVVEHEEEVMRAADQIIDIGPDAGQHGGELIYQGPAPKLGDKNDTFSEDKGYSINFLNGTDIISIPTFRRKAIQHIAIKSARENNLKNIDVQIPLGVLVAVTGVSGSGKSTLIRKILYPALARQLGQSTEEIGKHEGISGSLNKIEAVEMIDQNPIGKSSRSNPVTYIKAYDQIRLLYAEQGLAKSRGFKPGNFSFNVEGGRCEECQGEGETTIEMQFMADIKLKCDSCKGKRFKQEILDILCNEKTIADVLDMTIDESIDFFSKADPKVAEKLVPLQKVGLGYIKLGQSSSSLSGGEAQRVKLASFLGKGISNKGKTMFIFDEPTTGLHFHDIKKLLVAINALVEQGDSVIIIEHNIEIIKSADYIIDLGPEGGDKGGNLSFAGTPEEMILLDNNYTAQFLKTKF
ncbi:MAG: excinuclease ABC subunit UvrA [Pseudarcicella sp.]|nr:excinuclease ABC subunit UvrA [Pseudarcicella sp.]MBP6411277.1 excinuclease ABC subunit UvrA [Pseudarcicella sp.]